MMNDDNFYDIHIDLTAVDVPEDIISEISEIQQINSLRFLRESNQNLDFPDESASVESNLWVNLITLDSNSVESVSAYDLLWYMKALTLNQ